MLICLRQSPFRETPTRLLTITYHRDCLAGKSISLFARLIIRRKKKGTPAAE